MAACGDGNSARFLGRFRDTLGSVPAWLWRHPDVLVPVRKSQPWCCGFPQFAIPVEQDVSVPSRIKHMTDLSMFKPGNPPQRINLIGGTACLPRGIPRSPIGQRPQPCGTHLGAISDATSWLFCLVLPSRFIWVVEPCENATRARHPIDWIPSFRYDRASQRAISCTDRVDSNEPVVRNLMFGRI
jgi:hypothetical protein